MRIGRVDVLWNYGATFLRVASSAVLIPLMLRFLPSEDVGIWTIYATISSLVFLIDFGFNSSFARNVTYIFSGVRKLEKEGLNNIMPAPDVQIDFGLLKGMLSAMRWFYSKVGLAVLILLLTCGSFYLSHVLKTYSGGKTQIFVSWAIFCLVSSYNLYTLYYESLLEGRGLIRQVKKITVLGNVAYLVVAGILIISGQGILSLVCSQLLSVIIIRYLSYKTFFTDELKANLKEVEAKPIKDILSAVTPNAIKYGVTSFGGFLIQKSAVLFGSLYFSLDVIGSFGISKQLADILVAVANIALVTYLPKIASLRVAGDKGEIKKIYVRGIIISNVFYFAGALICIFCGRLFLDWFSSNTSLLSIRPLTVLFVSSWIALNAGISGAVISTRNEIPFMKPSLYSGGATIVLLYLSFEYLKLDVLWMALIPGVVDLAYQGWKWPYEVAKDLGIKRLDFIRGAQSLFKFGK